jgi:hypothetical protein
MKHRHHHHKKKARRNKSRRNAAGGGASASGVRRFRPRLPPRAAPPDWKTMAAAVGGAVGSSVVSGMLVNQKIAEPETTALLMVATGGLGAYLTGGNTRVAFTGVAAAGAGQYALAKMGKVALHRQAKKEQDKAASSPPAAQLPAGSPEPPPAEPPRRKSASGGGMVVELFRDTAADLELLDEDEDGAANGADGEDDEPIVIDLDEAA